MKNPLHHLTLTVNNAEVSAAWYLSLLGEATVIHREGSDWKRVRLNFPSGLIIGFTQHDAAAKGQMFSHLTVGLDHIRLACDSESEVRSSSSFAAQLRTSLSESHARPIWSRPTVKCENFCPLAAASC